MNVCEPFLFHPKYCRPGFTIVETRGTRVVHTDKLRLVDRYRKPSGSVVIVRLKQSGPLVARELGRLGRRLILDWTGLTIAEQLVKSGVSFQPWGCIP